MVDHGIDQCQTGNVGAVLLGQAQAQRSAHRQAGQKHLIGLGAQCREGIVDAGVPVHPCRLVEITPVRAVAGQQRQR